MKSEVLFELAARWEKESDTPQSENVTPDTKIPDDIFKGICQAKRECAYNLRLLIGLLG